MKQTFFIRADNGIYDHPCDVASVPLEGDHGTAFGGSAWGDHPDPPDCIEWQVVEGIDFDAWLATHGWRRLSQGSINGG